MVSLLLSSMALGRVCSICGASYTGETCNHCTRHSPPDPDSSSSGSSYCGAIFETGTVAGAGIVIQSCSQGLSAEADFRDFKKEITEAIATAVSPASYKEKQIKGAADNRKRYRMQQAMILLAQIVDTEFSREAEKDGEAEESEEREESEEARIAVQWNAASMRLFNDLREIYERTLRGQSLGSIMRNNMPEFELLWTGVSLVKTSEDGADFFNVHTHYAERTQRDRGVIFTIADYENTLITAGYFFHDQGVNSVYLVGSDLPINIRLTEPLPTSILNRLIEELIKRNIIEEGQATIKFYQRRQERQPGQSE